MALTITGRGTVVTGAIERGQVRVGDPVELVGLAAPVRSVVTSVETFGKTRPSRPAAPWARRCCSPAYGGLGRG